jgi:CubicO group peptidase (beta-lactamase class C family)
MPPTRSVNPVLVLLAVLAVLAGCSAPAAAPPASREDLAARIDAFLGASRTGRYDHVRAVIVDVAGERRYVRGEPASRGDVHSVTKSVLGTLIGIAVDRGEIRSVQQTLGELLPTYAPAMPPALNTATLQQVLTMTAGTAPDEALSAHPPLAAEDWAGYALALGPQTAPGAGFGYSTTGSHLLSAVLTQATGRSAMDYAHEVLFDPLGIGAAGSGLAWEADPQGRQLGGAGLALSAEDMLTLGRLYLAGGSWDGVQVVSSSWVSDATRSHVATGDQLPGYGYQWWVTTADEHPAYAAVGLGGQLIEVVPDLALVAVVRSDVGDRPGAGGFGYAELVGTVIAPAVSSG